MHIRTALLPLALLLSACIDYEINKPPADTDAPVPDTGDTGPDTGDTSPPPPDECADFPFTPGDAAVDESCTGTGAGGFDPVIEWQAPELGQLCLGPVVAPLDGDEIPDIVAVGCDLTVVAVSGDGSGALWTYGSSSSVPAIGDLDGDGTVEVVVADAFSVSALDAATGAVIWEGPGVLDIYSHMSGGLALADLDGDGTSEILAGPSVLSGIDGSLLGTGTVGRGSPHPWEAGWVGAAFPVAADLDGDGQQEVVTGGGAFALDGTTLWSTGAADGYAAIADFDGDGDPEVAVTSVGSVRLHAADGTLLWSTPITNEHVGMPTVADFDGDGAPEIVFTSDTYLRMVDGDGTIVWQLPIAEWSGRSGAVAFDFEGDGAVEVVHADEEDLYILEGATGAIRFREAGHASGTDSESPVVADVDADGSAEIVYLQSWDPVTGITVLGDRMDSWMPADDAWNQQASWIDNVTDDLKIPAHPTPSWTTHNTFRAAPLDEAGPVGPAANLYLESADVCVTECAERIPVGVVVGNEGPVSADGLLQISAEGIVLAEEDLGTVTSGERRQILFDLDPSVAGATLEARVLTGDQTCDDADDAVQIVVPACE